MVDARPYNAPAVLRDVARLEVLGRTGLVDGSRHEEFDHSRAWRRGSARPGGACLLVTDDRQVFVGAVGLDEPLASVRETPLSHSSVNTWWTPRRRCSSTTPAATPSSGTTSRCATTG